MIVKIDVPDYKQTEYIDVPFRDGAVIKAIPNGSSIVLSANEAGLYSLAIHLLELSQKEVPVGSHIHYDHEYIDAVANDSVEIIIAKI